MKTMKDLEKCFMNAKENDKKYVGVLIFMKGFRDPEIIINSYENFDSKLEYYKKAYDEDLKLKTFDGIRITDFTYGDSFAKIEYDFYGLE